MHKNGGKPPKLTREDKLYVTLKYLREYRIMDSIAVEYGVERKYNQIKNRLEIENFSRG